MGLCTQPPLWNFRKKDLTKICSQYLFSIWLWYQFKVISLQPWCWSPNESTLHLLVKIWKCLLKYAMQPLPYLSFLHLITIHDHTQEPQVSDPHYIGITFLGPACWISCEQISLVLDHPEILIQGHRHHTIHSLIPTKTSYCGFNSRSNPITALSKKFLSDNLG